MNLETAADLVRLAAVTPVVVTYRSHALVPALLQMLAPFPSCIVVDNASDDGTADAIAAGALPGLRLVRSPVNLGYGAGNNLGIRHCTSEFILVLNPDVWIAPSDVLELLRAATSLPDAVALGPRILAPDGQRQSEISFGHGARPTAPYVEPEGLVSTRWLHGCCLLLRRAHFETMGGFDERMFMYFEEKDLCESATRRGLDCVYVPSASARHIGGASSKPSLSSAFVRQYHYWRSRQVFTGKHVGRRQALALRLRGLAALPAGLVFYGLTGQRDKLIRTLCKAAAAVSRT